ncbi:MAG TPA: hypothetical protein VHS59_14880, partial [Bacillota bacterium]|nr:hypothetical protein [Bacillota bacterium]
MGSKAEFYNEQLLPGQSLTAACNYCHDLTQSKDGPYNMTGGFTAGAAHRVVDLNGTWGFTDSEGHVNDNSTTQTQSIYLIPGGNDLDGTAGEIKTFEVKYDNDYSDGSQGRLSGDYFTCDSCHTPHGVNVVNPYLGESAVKTSKIQVSAGVYELRLYMTTRLLKNYPNGMLTYQSENKIKATEYGSQWCLGCHNGRDALGTADHNHPVNEELKGYYFLEDAGLVNSVVYEAYGVQYVQVAENADPRKNTQYALTRVDESVYTHPTAETVGRPDGYKLY